MATVVNSPVIPPTNIKWAKTSYRLAISETVLASIIIVLSSVLICFGHLAFIVTLLIGVFGSISGRLGIGAYRCGYCQRRLVMAHFVMSILAAIFDTLGVLRCIVALKSIMDDYARLSITEIQFQTRIVRGGIVLLAVFVHSKYRAVLFAELRVGRLQFRFLKSIPFQWYAALFRPVSRAIACMEKENRHRLHRSTIIYRTAIQIWKRLVLKSGE